MSRRARRYVRTILLGVAALGALVWMAIRQFDIPPSEMAQLFGASALLVLLIIGSAALVVAIWIGLRRLLRKWGQGD